MWRERGVLRPPTPLRIHVADRVSKHDVSGTLVHFDAATVLNGHVHRMNTHTDGNVLCATATAYPQTGPGEAPKPGPLVVPADQLVLHLGYRSGAFEGGHQVADADRYLAEGGS